jgi:beta-N-acetylhexosaminidase
VIETREALLGEVFMFGFEGKSPDEPIRELLTRHHVGSVILFGRNLDDAQHLGRLTRELCEIAGRPLLIAADQEGGPVLRVRRGATLIPSAMAMGRVPERIREIAGICGREMRAMGLNFNLAPVLDIGEPGNPGIGIRAFCGDEKGVAGAGRSYVAGLQAAGVIACVKHFPGKGAATLDAHHDLPRIEKSASDMAMRELVPFREAFAAGALAAMTSHCVYPAYEELPATISPRVLTDLLRRELGFRGVMVTDDLRMGAIVKGRDPARAALEAFKAGADQILICRDAQVQRRAVALLADAVRSGEVPARRLEESVKRVRHLRAWIETRRPSRAGIATLAEKHARRIDRILDDTVQVVRDAGRLVPLPWRAPGLGLMFPDMDILTPVEERVTGEAPILAGWSDRLGGAPVFRYDPKAQDPGAPDVQAFLSENARVVFFSANAHLHPAQARLLERVAASARELVLVALRNPYDHALVGRRVTVVASHGFLPNALAALGRRLFG